MLIEEEHSVKIHILTDNRTMKRGFVAEHGLSVYIEHEAGNLLFDTGATDVFAKNAAVMGLNLCKINSIVLSHGHYDHCGGLVHFPFNEAQPKVYIHPYAFSKRYAADSVSGKKNEIGIPWRREDHPFIDGNIVFTGNSMEISPAFSLMGQLQSLASLEEEPKGFFTECKAGFETDNLCGEQLLICEDGEGLHVFSGCSHHGIVSLLLAVKKKFPGKKITSVTAGMHLPDEQSARLDKTIGFLMDSGIDLIIPLHCTGIFAITAIKTALKDRCLVLGAGDSVTLS